MSKYIIIDAEAIQKRIEELESQRNECAYNPNRTDEYYRYNSMIKVLKEILSQSTPLIPEIEKAFEAGKIPYKYNGDMELNGFENSENYISNLKLNI